MSQTLVLDYSLTGQNAAAAVENGLAEADWYTCPVPKAEMRKLLERRDGPALRDTLIWFALLFGSGFWAYSWWGSAWAILPFMLYGVIYGTTSDSRWHESNHGTAFKTDWLNNVLYEIASFMVMRESVVWRWSHNRHHSDTIIVGRDPEIAVPRPPKLRRFILTFFGLPGALNYFKTVLLHCTGRLTADELTFIPASEHRKIIWRARLYALIYAGVVGLALYHRTILPLMLIGLPNLYGSWLMPIYGYTQHAGLAENVLDHRLNCRTVYMNVINRYLYLEYELPCGTPHVSPGALPCAAPSPRPGESRHAEALRQHLGSLVRIAAGGATPAHRPRVLCTTQAALAGGSLREQHLLRKGCARRGGLD